MQNEITEILRVARSLVAADLTPKEMAQEKSRRQKKTVSVRKLAKSIDSLRAKVSKDLKSDDASTRMTALVVALIDKTSERVGNDSSAKEGHFGVTGWRNKHVTVSGSTVTVKYVGKSGVDQEKKFTDSVLAGALKKCKEENKGENTSIFSSKECSVKATGVNKYLSEFGVTAKDIRGHGANTLVIGELSGSISKDREERAKKFKEVLQTVADTVGHQKTTLQKHYLLPGIEEAYVGKGKIPDIKKASDSIEALRVAKFLVGGDSVTRILSQISRLCKKGISAKGNDIDSIAEISNLGDDLEKEVERLMKAAGVTHRDRSFSPVSSALFEFTHSVYVAWDTHDYESYEWILEILKDFSSKWEKWKLTIGAR